jgi:hypothetical protein
VIRAARLTIVLAVLAWLPALVEQFELPKAAVVRVGGGALLAAAIVAAAWPRRAQPGAPEARGPAWQPLDIAMVAWLLVEAAATWTSVSPTLSLFGDRDQSEGMLTSIGLAGIYAGARLGTRSAADARRTLYWILGVAGIALLLGLWQLAAFTPEDWQNAWAPWRSRRSSASPRRVRSAGHGGHRRWASSPSERWSRCRARRGWRWDSARSRRSRRRRSPAS